MRFGLVISAIGAVLVLVGLLADPLGIGGSGGFGWKQIVAVVAGVALVVAGVMALARTRSKEQVGP